MVYHLSHLTAKTGSSRDKEMWQTQRESLPGEQGFKVKLFMDERPFTFAEVLASWQNDELFRTFFLAVL